MTNRLEAKSGTETWRATARLLILFFALRAVFPIGFMPDLGALRDGRLEIVLCTATGTRIVEADEDWQPSDTEKPGKADVAGDKDCPFYKIIAKPFAALPRVLLVERSDPEPLPILVAVDFPRRPPSRGPPLGSRAPPLRLA